MIQDTDRFKMDLVGGLERVLHGKVKPSTHRFAFTPIRFVLIADEGHVQVITQCSIRHLYTLSSVSQAQKESFIAVAKTMERRRCNHHTLDEPLSTMDCFSSVIGSKNSDTNKNRYVVASQEEDVRRYCRGIKGVPLVYVKRSVMVMEPMAESSVNAKAGIERDKFRTGLRRNGLAVREKRKRVDELGDERLEGISDPNSIDAQSEERRKKKKIRGVKGPNPLSVKKPRKAKENKPSGPEIHGAQVQNGPPNVEEEAKVEQSTQPTDIIERPLEASQNPPTKRKRKRKHASTVLERLEEKVNGSD